MKKKTLHIALKLEGPESEKGLIRLDDFLSELAALREALESIDREINGKSTLYYRVVDLSHRSPAKVVIEPVLRQQLKTRRLGNRYGHLPGQIHDRFFKTIQFLQKEEQAAPDVGEPVIDALSDLLEGLGTEFVRGEIANSKIKCKLDDKLKQRIENLLRPGYRSFGSVEGELLALNLAHGNRFYIYPVIGPRSVSCQFPESLFDKAHAHIRKNVRVYGMKYFREATHLPFKITDVQKIELLEPEKPFPDFHPSPVRVLGPSADELIRESREGWET